MGFSIPKVCGTDETVSLTTGRKTRAVLLNNAATTPPFEKTLGEVNDFLRTYSALSRGAGPRATATYNRVIEAIGTVRGFLNLRKDQSLLFTQHTTSAINLFARMCRLQRHDVVLTSPIEHTSNNLPWQFNSMARIVEARSYVDGSIDYEDLEEKAKKYGRRLKLLAFNGASNTTGYVPDIRRLSSIARSYGAMLFMDAAQLAPSRRIDMEGDGIDALAFSAHKVYAPFGTGVLALPKSMLGSGPVDPGGGTVAMVSDDDILWMQSPEYRHQAGTWNTVGIVALAASCALLAELTWEAIVGHERTLVEYALQELTRVKKLSLYVDPEKYIEEKRLGIFPFNLAGYHHMLLSAILEHEYGIETRAGTICNHRVIRRWFNVSDSEQRIMEDEISGGNRLASYGIVRASLGLHNTREDIDMLASALMEIAEKGAGLGYRAVPEEEVFIPAV